jgi:hypothetical protein
MCGRCLRRTKQASDTACQYCRVARLNGRQYITNFDPSKAAGSTIRNYMHSKRGKKTETKNESTTKEEGVGGSSKLE